MQLIAVWHSKALQKLLTLCVNSIVGGRCDTVASIIAHERCLKVHCELSAFHC
jgi:hypothetical protein